MRLIAPAMIGLVMVFAASASADEIYTWKDSRGVTHYSDSPPQDKGASVKKLQAPTGNTLPRQEMPKPEAGNREQAQRAAQESSRAEVRRAICEKARADLQAMENSPRRSAARKSGKPGQSGSLGQMGSAGQMGPAGQAPSPADSNNVALDSEERSGEDAALRKIIAENCD